MQVCLLAIALVALSVPALPETVVHVAPGGDDANPGTRSQPFATLERAREALRRASPDGGRRVIVRGGVYSRSATFVLGPEDSGVQGRPAVWETPPGERVRVQGGTTVREGVFRPVTDGAALARLKPEARERVLVARLQDLGVQRPEPFPDSFRGAPPGPELIFDDERMRLARWPNDGWATIERIVDSGSNPREGDRSGRPGAFVYSGDAPTRWKPDAGVWLQGYWCFDWYDEFLRVASIEVATRTIRFAKPHLYSLRQGNPSPRRYRAINVLEELDQPGEFVVDAIAGLLWFWPPKPLGGARLVVSTLDAPIVALRGARDVVLRGFTVECGLGDGIEVRAGERCAIESCEVRNLRRSGIRVEGGAAHRVEACDIHHTGTGGLTLAGGDRRTLTPARHEALNCHIWRFSEHQFTSAYGLTFGGVGNRAAHCRIHDAPHQAVAVGGNDHIFELNEVFRVCTETDDCGALYKGRNPSCRGNLIRWNYWHNIGSPMGHGNAAVYFDDGDGGDRVIGNLFVRCGEPGRGPFGTIFSHGGHDNLAENNVFVECKRAFGSAPWDEARWRDALRGGQECFWIEKLRQEVDITRPPYTERYPELVGFLDPPPGAERVNRARRSVLVRCGEQANGNWRVDAATTWVTDRDPGFVDAASGDYRLRQDAEVFRRVPGFEPIPFDRMGLRDDGPRRRLKGFQRAP